MKTVSLHDDKTNQTLVYKELALGALSPIDAYYAIASITPNPAMIEVGQKFSYIGVGTCRHYTSDTFDDLQSQIADRAVFRTLPKIPLAGTLLGYISYDEGARRIHFLEHCLALSFDFSSKKLYISALFTNKQKTMEGINHLQHLLEEKSVFHSSNDDFDEDDFSVEVDISDEDFRKMVIKAKEYVRQGDAFQIVLSRKFRTKVNRPPFNVYQSIREHCQSPYKFFIKTDDFAICGASPERLIKVENGIIENMPIAGTRPKTNTVQDAIIEQELMDDEKEHAEHMMLVDLARNDIGKVAEPGSVVVKELKKLTHYSHVMHLVSRVQGVLRKMVSPVDALEANFPAGTLSGAPKVRAMEIIAELEPTKRGIYGGAICYIDQSNKLDSFIAIRMAIIKDGYATVQAGAGIVIDSDPQKEADETRHKAKGILKSIQQQEVLA